MNFPRWMNWLFLGFFAYILYLGNFSAREDAVTQPDTVPQKTSLSSADNSKSGAAHHPERGYPKLDDATNLNYWKSAVNPGRIGVLRSEDVTIGSGAVAGCGSDVTILLRGTKSDGSNFDAAHSESKPLTFTVGNAPYKALNQVMSGMRVGGVRTAKVPLSTVTNTGAGPAKIGTALLRITLQSVDDPALNDATVAFHALVLTAGDQESEPLLCGDDKAALSLAPVLENGRYGEAKTVRGKLGSEVFSISLSRAAEGLRAGESRLVIAPDGWRNKDQALVTRIEYLKPLKLKSTESVTD